MKDFHIYQSSDIEFDRFEFEVGPNKSEAIEGHYYSAVYYANEGITYQVDFKLYVIMRMPQKQLAENKFIIMKMRYRVCNIKDNKNNVEIWLRVEAASNGMYNVHLMENIYESADRSRCK